jgi:hypothetical protein
MFIIVVMFAVRQVFWLCFGRGLLSTAIEFCRLEKFGSGAKRDRRRKVPDDESASKSNPRKK